MSIVQEFLQQNYNVQVSPSILMELNNIKTAFTFMQETIEQTRTSNTKDQKLKQQLQRARHFLEHLEVFISQVNEGSIKIDTNDLFNCMIQYDEMEQEWMFPFLKSKQKQINKFMVLAIKQSLKESNSEIEKSILQKYIHLLAQIQSGTHNNKLQEKLKEADLLKTKFEGLLKLDRVHQVATQKVNKAVNKIRRILSKVSNIFSMQINTQQKSNKSTIQSPLKSRSQISEARIDTPVKLIDHQQKSLVDLEMSQSKLLDPVENSYLLTLGKPRYSYIS